MLRGDTLRLRIGERTIPSRLLPVVRRSLHRRRFTGCSFVLTRPFAACSPIFASPLSSWLPMLPMRHESPPLADDVRQSLLEDLELSDRD